MGVYMRKKKLLTILLITMLAVLLTFGLAGCGEEKAPEKPVTLTRISVSGPSVAFIENFSLRDAVAINLHYSNGTSKPTPYRDDMLTEEERLNANFLDDEDGDGETVKTFNFEYMGKKATYTVTLKHDPNPELLEFDGYTMLDATHTYDSEEVRSLQVQGEPVEGATIIYRNNGKASAGVYKVTALIRKAGYKNKEITAILTINKKPVTQPKTPANLVYTGKNQEVGIEKSTEYIISGEINAINAGEYKVQVALANPNNYVWKNGDSEPIEYTWRIDKKKIDLSAVTWTYDAKGFLYSGTPKTVSVKNYSRDLVEPVYSGVNRAQEAGIYTANVVFKVKQDKTANYEIDESKTYPNELVWKIYRNRIDPNGQIKFDGEKEDNVEFVYNGSKQRPEIINLEETIPGATVEYSNEGREDVGEYMIRAIITKEGYEPLVVTCNYRITEKKVKIPTIIQGEFEYNGKEQQVVLSNTENVIIDGAQYGIEPNEFRLTFALQNTRNFIWEDGTKDVINKPENVWRINKIKLPTSLEWNYDEQNPLVFNGQSQAVLLNVLENYGLNVEYLNQSAKNAGKYSAEATVKLKFPLEMYEGENIFIGGKKYTLEWEIKPYEVDFTKVAWNYSSTFIYKENKDVERYEVVLQGLPELVLNSGEDSQRNPAVRYENNVKLIKDEKNKVVGTHVAKVIFNQNFTIVNGEGKETLIWQIVENLMAGVIYNNQEVTYSEEGYAPIRPSGDLTGAIVEYYPNNKEVNVGVYPQKIIIQKPGFTMYEKTVTLTITPKTVVKPTVTAKDLVFDGTIKSSGIEPSSSLPYDVNGISTSVVAGDFEVIVKLKSVINSQGEKVFNYVWSDGSDPNAEVTYKWSIAKLKFNPNAIRWDYVDPFEFTGESKQVQLTGVPKGIVAKYETTTDSGEVAVNTTNAGKYKSTATLETVVIDESLIPQCYENYQDILNFKIAPQSWEIKPKEIDMRYVKWSYNGDLMPWVYEKDYFGNETEYTVELTNIPHEISTMFTFTDNVQTKAGSYKTEAIFTNANYKLINVQYVETLSWEIVVNELDWFNFPTTQEVRYNGLAQMPKFELTDNKYTVKSIEKDVEDGRMKIAIKEVPGMSTYAITDAGTYEFVMSAKRDGYALKETKVKFTILPQLITKPTVAKTETTATYDGKAHVIDITHNYVIPTGPETVLNPGDEGYESAIRKYYVVYFDEVTSVGVHKTTAVLQSPNYAWEGDNNSTNLVLHTFTITPKEVVKPTVSGGSQFVYDGTAKEVLLSGINKDAFEIFGNKQVEIGEYEVIIKLKPNYAWVGGDTSDVVIKWSIVAKA